MILDDLGAYLQTNLVGTVGTDIFLGFYPLQGPDAMVAVFEAGGGPTDKAMGTAANRPVNVENVRFSILSRALDYEAARTKAHTIFKLLDGLSNFTWGGTQYFILEANTPVNVGQDSNMRHQIITNYAAKKRVHA